MGATEAAPWLPRQVALRRRKWRRCHALAATTRKGWRWQGGLLVSPRGRRYLYRKGYAREFVEWIH